MASGEKSEVAETIAQREIAPTVLSPPTNGAVSPPPAPPAPKVEESNNNKRYSKVTFRRCREIACSRYKQLLVSRDCNIVSAQLFIDYVGLLTSYIICIMKF